jgi:hypothetical protein
MFEWDKVQASAGTEINYTITIKDKNGTTVHTATVKENKYKYPPEAEMLKYAAEYAWIVSAEANGTPVAKESNPASFTTQFIVAEGQTVTLEQIADAVKIVMKDFPELKEFADKILAGMSDETGAVTPDKLMEILGKYKIIRVSVR